MQKYCRKLSAYTWIFVRSPLEEEALRVWLLPQSLLGGARIVARI
jgi:hypothetical protein